MSVPDTVIVFAKEPVAGQVKTRLCPPYRPAQAAALAAAALADTLALVSTAAVRRRVLCLQGRLAPEQTVGFEVLPQVAGTLDVRIAAALAQVEGPVLLIGMDTPQLSVADLDLPGLSTGPRATPEPGPGGTPHAWLGLAEDGGFWALGLTHPDPALMAGVAMSRPDTGSRQLGRLRAAGLAVTLLRTVRDVDTAADVPVVAALAPGSRFAAAAADVAGRAPSPPAAPAGVVG